jgi:ferredoxin
MKVSIERSGCIGCGLCAETCPEVFAMAQDGLAEVTADPTPKNQDEAKAAAEGCPVSVITIEE